MRRLNEAALADAAGTARADRDPRAGPEGGANPDASASREVLEAYKLIAADAGWLRRAAEVIAGGLSAEAAVQRVAGELRDRMRRIADPYLRERLADLEDLAGTPVQCAHRPSTAAGRFARAQSSSPAGLARPSCWHGTAAASRAW